MKAAMGKVSVLTIGLGLVLSQGNATILLPGGSTSSVAALPGGSVPAGPSTAVSAVGATPLFHDNGGWTSTSAGGSINLESGVWVDPSTGGLDFFYQIQNNYTGATIGSNCTGVVSVNCQNTLVPQMTLIDFAGVTTNVFSYTAGGPAGSALFSGSGFLKPTGDAVGSVSRSADGGSLVVTFDQNGIKPGTNSAILVIETNAMNFDQAGDALHLNWRAAPTGVNLHGAGSHQDFELGTLEPLVTPEPGVYGALALGIAGLLLVIRRRSENAKIKTNSEVA